MEPRPEPGRATGATTILLASSLPLAALPEGLLLAEEYYTVEEAQAQLFPTADRFVKQREIITDAAVKKRLEERLRTKKRTRIFTFWEARKGERLLGYFVTDDRIGKTRPITYAIATTPDLELTGFEVLVYRESHGGEIRRSAFRAQFDGRGPESVLRVGRDIRNIAGATLSCHAVTDGTHDLLVHLDELARPDRETIPVETAVATRRLMGTELAITVCGADARVAEAAFDEVARLEGLLSVFRPSSEISRLNAAAGGDPIPLSADTLEVLRRARDLARRTDGAFDPTAGALVRLWKEAAKAGREPTDAEIEAARATVSWRSLEISKGSARLARPGASIDLGGVGKGYALERAAAVLEARGVRSALFNFGGQIHATAPPAGAEHWAVSLRDPDRPERTLCELELARGSVATTADYERGLRIGGRTLSHVIDPRTGRPVQGPTGVTVYADRAAEADALSTALYTLGADAGHAWAERHRTSAWIFDGEGPRASTALLSSGLLPTELAKR